MLVRSDTCGYASKAYNVTNVSDVTTHCALYNLCRFCMNEESQQLFMNFQCNSCCY